MSTPRTRTSAAANDANLTPQVLTVWLSAFRDCFTAPVWNHVLVLVAGAVLAPGKRTVSQALRVMGLAAKPGFARYHEVLSRARWDGRAVAHKLLAQVLDAFLPAGEVVIGIDDTIERRWGAKIKARGIYRDPVRSSHGHFVKASGLRWLSLTVMAPIPWAGRRRALPFFTILAPSERWSSEHDRRHKTLTDWARQAIRQVKRWLPDRRLIVVADASFAALDLIAAIRRHVCLVTRLRIDANLFAPAPPRRPGQMGRPRLKGRRLPKFAAVLANPKTVWSPINVRDGTAVGGASWKSSPAPRSGITPDCRRRQSVGCWCAIPPANATRRHFSAPTSRPSRSKFSAGSSHVGAWRRHFRKRVPISAWRRSGSGLISPSCGRRRRCSGCSPWWRSGPIGWPAPPMEPPAREPPHGTTSATRPSAMLSPPFDVLSGIRRIYACLGKPERS
jgi:DDE superfamily endonuclease